MADRSKSSRPPRPQPDFNSDYGFRQPYADRSRMEAQKLNRAVPGIDLNMLAEAGDYLTGRTFGADSSDFMGWGETLPNFSNRMNPDPRLEALMRALYDRIGQDGGGSGRVGDPFPRR